MVWVVEAELEDGVEARGDVEWRCDCGACHSDPDPSEEEEGGPSWSCRHWVASSAYNSEKVKNSESVTSHSQP